MTWQSLLVCEIAAMCEHVAFAMRPNASSKPKLIYSIIGIDGRSDFAICVRDCSWHMMSGNVTFFFSHLPSDQWERAQRWQSVVNPSRHTRTHTLTHTSSLCSSALYNLQLHFNTISGNVCAAHGLDYHPRQGGSALTSLLCGGFSYISL